MHYSVLKQQERKIPIPLVLAVVVVLAVSFSLVFRKQPAPHQTQAKATIVRADVANLRENTATIFWRTSSPSKSYLVYGEDPQNLKNKIYDSRDKAGEIEIRQNHIVLLKELKPDTTYYYSYVVGDSQIGQAVDMPFILKTTRPIKTTLDIHPIYGKVLSKQGKPVEDAIVFLTIQKANPLIAVTKLDGSFLISPCCVFNNSTLEPFYPAEDQPTILEAIDESNNKKKIEATLKEMSELPDPVVLDGIHKNYFVRTQTTTLLSANNLISLNPVDIIFPKQNASIPGSRPIIKGLGESGKGIKGTIQPEGKIFITDVDQNGVWSFIPSFELNPGKHTLEILTEDENNRKIALSRSFSILKSGEAVLGDATSSGQLTPTSEPTQKPVESPTQEPTVFTTTIPLTGEPPVSGDSILPFSLFAIALVVIGAGVVLLF